MALLGYLCAGVKVIKCASRHMLKVNEPILAEDPNLVLQYERGVFEVVSPNGERLRVTCPVQGSIPRAKMAGAGPAQWWRIEKILDR
jgi:hypothetical protein